VKVSLIPVDPPYVFEIDNDITISGVHLPRSMDQAGGKGCTTWFAGPSSFRYAR
jgi:hypothetical protein